MRIDDAAAGYWLQKLETSERGQRAQQNFLDGYNCSQAVALAFADLIGMDEKLLLRALSSFGGGLGRMREVCGAVSGMSFVAGAVNGSMICRELLGLAKPGADAPTPQLRTAEYYKKRPCAQLVALAATIMEDYIENNQKEEQ